MVREGQHDPQRNGSDEPRRIDGFDSDAGATDRDVAVGDGSLALEIGEGQEAADKFGQFFPTALAGLERRFASGAQKAQARAAARSSKHMRKLVVNPDH